MKKVILLLFSILFMAVTATAEPVYTEKISYQIEILEDGQIQVRKAIRVFKDGVEIAKTYHRHVLAPEDDLTNEVKKVKDIANAVWTQEVIDEYESKKAKP